MLKLIIIVLNFLLLPYALASSKSAHMQVSFTVLASSSIEIKQQHEHLIINNTASRGTMYNISVEHGTIGNKNAVIQTGTGQEQQLHVLPEKNKTIIIKIDF